MLDAIQMKVVLLVWGGGVEMEEEAMLYFSTLQNVLY